MKTATRPIGEHTYQMESLGMVTAQEVILALARPLAAFLTGAMNKDTARLVKQAMAVEHELPMEMFIDLLESASGGFAGAIRELTPAELKLVTEAFANKTALFVVDKKSKAQTRRLVPLAGIYDDHFDCDAAGWLKWLAWGIGMNRLFGNALARLASAPRAESSSASPEDSTGSSGA